MMDLIDKDCRAEETKRFYTIQLVVCRMRLEALLKLLAYQVG